MRPDRNTIRNKNATETIRNILIASIVIALVLAALFSLDFHPRHFSAAGRRGKNRPGVAAGNLWQEIEVRSNDEIGQLMQALKEMRDSLVDTIGQVRDSEAHTRALLNNMIDGVASVDEQGVIKNLQSRRREDFWLHRRARLSGKISVCLFPARRSQGQDRHLDYLEELSWKRKL